MRDITKKGRGPGEYPFISSIYIDDSIYLCTGSSINTYCKENNEFGRAINSKDIQAERFIKKNNLIYLSNTKNFNNRNIELGTFDLKSNRIAKVLSYLDLKEEKNYIDISLGQFLTLNNNGDILFSRNFENRIYSIERDKPVVKYNLFLNSSNDIIIPEKHRDFMNLQENVMTRFFELNNKLYITIISSSADHKIFFKLLTFDNHTNKGNLYNRVWSEELGSEVDIIQYSNGKLIGYINTAQVNYLYGKSQSIIESDKFTKFEKDRAEFLLSKIGAVINPIILILEEH